MRLWHRHRWSRWSKPVEVETNYYVYKTGKTITGSEVYQRRECEPCGKVEYRKVDS